MLIINLKYLDFVEDISVGCNVNIKLIPFFILFISLRQYLRAVLLIFLDHS